LIFINSEILEAIKDEGERAYPNECCGVIMGRVVSGGMPPFGGGTDVEVKDAISIEPIANSSENAEQYHRFLITPEDMLKAELKAREQKLDIIGFYHSHPDHPAAPSEYDKEHALPFYSYVIVSVLKGKAGNFTSWELSDDRENFNSDEIAKEKE